MGSQVPAEVWQAAFQAQPEPEPQGRVLPEPASIPQLAERA
jgi:hypothetical protein